MGLSKDVVLEDYFQIDINIAEPNEAIKPTIAEVLSENETYITERNGWGSVIRKKKDGYFYEYIESAAKEPEDFFKIQFDSANLDMRYIDWQKYVDNKKKKGKCVFGKIGGPYIRTSFVRGEENFLMDIAGEPELARDMVDKMADHLLEIGIEELRRGNLYDTGIWISDDMGNNRGPMMSPKSFEYIFYPGYKKIVSGLKKAGASKVGLHSDGNIMPILDMLVDAGIEVLNPIEPKAGMSISTLMKKFGRKLSYVGGMCNSVVLPFGTIEEIIAATREILEVASDGGVVIGSHSVGPDIP